jgi:TonB family protein
MQFSAAIQTTLFAATLVASGSASAQTQIASPEWITSAKTIYFEDKSGVDAVGKKASAELQKWGRFQVIQDRSQADLLLVLETDPQRGGDLIFSGQTGSIDGQGRVTEDSVPNYNKQGPVRYAFLTLIDADTGDTLWSTSQRWGGLLTGFNNVGEHLVEVFEKYTQALAQSSSFQLLKCATLQYPLGASQKHIEGKVSVRIVVDKSGTVTSAKALSGPTELLQTSEVAARQCQFAPPEKAPVTSEMEMRYGLEPHPCPPGKKADHGEVSYARKFPMRASGAGKLKLVDAISEELPPYPEEARDAGKEGVLHLMITVAPSGEVVGVHVTQSLDPLIDDAAVAALSDWKFKVTRGDQAGFPIVLLYRLSCSPFAIE